MPFPLCPPPLADTGAYTNPRELQRWLDINPVSKLDRPRKFITLPAFDQGNSTWNGYSDIVAAFNCEAPNNFSLQGLVKDIPANTNYTLTISYRVGGTVTRYMLWDAAGSNLNQTITPYSGQGILKNFRLEVWNTSQGAAEQATNIDIFTSVLSKFDWRYATDVLLKANDGEVTDFSVAADVSITDSMIVAGGGWADTNGTYNLAGISNGKPWYSYNGDPVYPNPATAGARSIYWSSFNTWVIFDANRYYQTYVSFNDVATPNLVTRWQSNPGNHPVPTVNTPAATMFSLPLVFPANSVSTTN